VRAAPATPIPGPLAAAERWTRRAARGLASVGLLALIGYALLTLADGVLRSIASQPIDAVRDLGGLVAALAVLCCFPLAFLQRSNITIRFVQALFGARASQALDALAAALVAATMALVAWRFFVYAGQVARAHEATFMLSVPVGPFWYAAAVLVCLATAVQGLILVLEISRVIGRAAETGAR
jgi:TRAP-type C4-dicarboxylate transport system permease small subunit